MSGFLQLKAHVSEAAVRVASLGTKRHEDVATSLAATESSRGATYSQHYSYSVPLLSVCSSPLDLKIARLGRLLLGQGWPVMRIWAVGDRFDLLE